MIETAELRALLTEFRAHRVGGESIELGSPATALMASMASLLRDDNDDDAGGSDGNDDDDDDGDDDDDDDDEDNDADDLGDGDGLLVVDLSAIGYHARSAHLF